MSKKKKSHPALLGAFDEMDAMMNSEMGTAFDPKSVGLGGDLSFLEGYESINIEEVIRTVDEKANEILNNMRELYFKGSVSVGDGYIDSIMWMEKLNLSTLLRQTFYSRHVVDTLMRQFDSGGYANYEMYSILLSHQDQVVRNVRLIAEYTRGIPNFAKVIANEIKEFSIQIPQEVEETETQVATLGPQKGTYEMIRTIRKGLNEVKEDLAEEMRQMEEGMLNGVE